MTDVGMRSRVLITGATGFVGTWLLRDLAGAWGTLKGVFCASREGRLLPEFAGSGFQAVRMDVGDADDIDRVVRDVCPTAVVHLAAVAVPAEARAAPDLAWRINLLGTLSLARALGRHRPEAPFLFVSSSEAYGASFVDGSALDEAAPLNPSTVYAATKAAADLAIGQMGRDGLRALRFRPFNHTGPGQDVDFVVSSFADQIARIEAGLQPPVIRVGNVAARRDFLDVRDVVRAYRLALESDAGSMDGRAINLASGSPWQIDDILKTLIGQSKTDIEIVQDPARMRANDVPVTCGNAGMAEAFLNWRAHIPFDQTLADVLDHCRRDVRSKVEGRGSAGT